MERQDIEVVLKELYGSSKAAGKLAKDIGVTRPTVYNWLDKEGPNSPYPENEILIIELVARNYTDSSFKVFSQLGVDSIKGMEINIWPDGADLEALIGKNWVPETHRRIMFRTAEMLREKGINASCVLNKVESFPKEEQE